MRYLLTLLFIIAIVVFFYQMNRPERDASEQISVNPISVSPSPAQSRNVKTGPRVSPTEDQPNTPHDHPKDASAEPPTHLADNRDLNHVSFVVNHDGLAVAFGDVILGEIEVPEGEVGPSRGRTIPPEPQLWDRTIPYFIDSSIQNKRYIENVVQYVNDNTPLKLVPLLDQEDAIVFRSTKEHCYSYLGRVGGHQPIYLSPNCREQEILHELMHALGFIHEHSRPDRDQFIEVLWKNIEPKFVSQFELAPESLTRMLRGTRFDYQSVMIYAEDAFAKNKRIPAIRSRSKEAISPVRKGLSPTDLERLRVTYGY